MATSSPIFIGNIKSPILIGNIQSPVLTSNIKSPVLAGNIKNPILIDNIQSLLLHGNIFTKSQTIYKSPNTILATISKSPILFWQLFTKKLKYQFGKILQILKAQVLSLAIFYQKSKYQFGKILQILKAQILSLAIFYQKPKNINTWQILYYKCFTKCPSTIFGKPSFQKKSKITLQKYYILLKSPKLIIFGITFFFLQTHYT